MFIQDITLDNSKILIHYENHLLKISVNGNEVWGTSHFYPLNSYNLVVLPSSYDARDFEDLQHKVEQMCSTTIRGSIFHIMDDLWLIHCRQDQAALLQLVVFLYSGSLLLDLLEPSRTLQIRINLARKVQKLIQPLKSPINNTLRDIETYKYYCLLISNTFGMLNALDFQLAVLLELYFRLNNKPSVRCKQALNPAGPCHNIPKFEERGKEEVCIKCLLHLPLKDEDYNTYIQDIVNRSVQIGQIDPIMLTLLYKTRCRAAHICYSNTMTSEEHQMLNTALNSGIVLLLIFIRTAILNYIGLSSADQ